MRASLLFWLLPSLLHAQITPTLLTTLSEQVKETSGLIRLNGSLWTHNDANNTPHLYRLDPTNGAILQTVLVNNASNTDWEDLATDGTTLYVGDIGNNNGDRTDLKIFMIPVSLLGDPSTSEVSAEILSYRYEDQDTFISAPHAHDMDCEAMIFKDDSIFLFMKEWVGQGTRIYALPAAPGDHIARLRGSFDIQGLITGADHDAETGRTILVGYSRGIYVPFLVVLSGYPGNDLFAGDVYRVPMTLSYCQMEGISIGEDAIWLSTERSPMSPPRLWTVPATLPPGSLEGQMP